MLYYLFEFLEKNYQFPGASVFQFITFRAALAIILSLPVLLLARLDNIYVIMLIVTMLWMGAVGFTDDYIKVFKKDKKGLSGKFKVLGQVGLGLFVGSIMYFHPGITIKTEKVNPVFETELITQSSEREFNGGTVAKNNHSFCKR